MKHFFQKSLALMLVLTAALSLIGCSDDDDDEVQPNVYFAYYEFSDDMLELYNVTINIVDENLDELGEEQALDPENPYKVNGKSHSKSFLIRCDATGKKGVTFICNVKSRIKYETLANSHRTYSLMYGYSFHKMFNDETEDEAKSTTIFSCKRNTITITGEDLAKAPELSSENPNGLTKYEAIMEEIEKASYMYF